MTLPLAVVDSPLAIGGLILVVVAMLLIDLFLFARGREPGTKEAIAWSVGWLVLSLLVALPIMALDGTESAVEYTTVYLIERTLSLDNLFVFLLLFGYFAVPVQHRSRLLFWGIVLALVLRGIAIIVGVQLIEQFDWILYVLGALLLLLAWRMLTGGDHEIDPEKNLIVRGTKRVFPVTTKMDGPRLFITEDGKRRATPVFLAFVSLGAADVAFAIDSIPAAFAITTDSFVIWTANAFALMGLRALFVLVEILIARFRYMDETLAIVLGLVGVKLLLADLVHLSPVASLAIVLAAFAIGIGASLANPGDHHKPAAS
ncbi:MAG TPA: TerC/Alx family metal homeostasis membrane protein [Baekduia sp.]|nr:TerC/Alx family metal homeostasis membrane protein [Baekduia sp.]